MRFKEDRYTVLSRIKQTAQNSAYNHLMNINVDSYQSIDSIISVMKNTMAAAIGEAVKDGFEELLNNEYTDADFEKDMGLDQ